MRSHSRKTFRARWAARWRCARRWTRRTIPTRPCSRSKRTPSTCQPSKPPRRGPRGRALEAYPKHVPAEQATEVRAALARAYLDAGSADAALSLYGELAANLSDDPSYWESLRVTARMAGDYEQVVMACDALANQLAGASRAALLEEAAGVL